MLPPAVTTTTIFARSADPHSVYMTESFDRLMRMKVTKMYLWNNNTYSTSSEWFFTFIRAYVDLECTCIYSQQELASTVTLKKADELKKNG